jgi:hypothetical protein
MHVRKFIARKNFAEFSNKNANLKPHHVNILANEKKIRLT